MKRFLFLLDAVAWRVQRLFSGVRTKLFANANEITIQDTQIIQKDGVTLTSSKQVQRDLAGTGKFSGVQAIGSGAGELLVFPADLVAEGISHIWVCNLAADGGANIGLSLNVGMTQTFATLKPGEPTHVAVNLAPATDPSIYAKATAGSVPLQISASGT